MTDLEKSILATIVYFDIFEYPLTLEEIYKWLYIAQSIKHKAQSLIISEIQETLDKSKCLKKIISTKNGFYFLIGKEKHVQTRQRRYLIAQRKIKKALKIARLLSFTPYIKMMAICNSLGYFNACDLSDIDFFIITSKKRIWLSRFILVGLLEILGKRPKPNQTRDKFCLPFFISEDDLNLEKVQIGYRGDQTKTINDIYLTYWITQLIPIYDEESFYQKFINENKWIKNFLPNSLTYETTFRYKIKPKFLWFKEFFKFFTLDLDEKFYKWLQLKIIPKKLKEMAGKSTKVIISDQMLKFHENDRREEYRRVFESKLSRIFHELNY